MKYSVIPKKLSALLLAVLITALPHAVLAAELTKEAISDHNEEASEVALEPKDEHIPYPSLTQPVYQTTTFLSDGLTYQRTLSGHESYGNEREYVLTYMPDSETEIEFVMGKYLYSTDTIRNHAITNEPDKNYVAGINADFFNMSTGVPESAYIKDGELYTTDRDSFCLARREDGTFFFDKPQIGLTLVADKDETVYHILHLNKEFSEYGLYLYNARFSETTHIKNQSTSVVLYPYSDRVSFEELCEMTEDETLYEMRKDYEKVDTLSEYHDVLFAEIEEYLLDITSYKKIGEAYYKIESVYPHIGGAEKVVVDVVNTDSVNEKIPENAYLLCADNRSYGYILMAFEQGDTFTLSVDGNEAFYDVTDAVGTGTIIVKDSETVDDRTFSHYLSLQPRSAVGIREDGSLVLLAADGRQKGYSAGLKLLDLAERMKALGCTYAANLDGGGSTAVNVSLPGFDTADTANSPSGGKERKVSNAIVFYNTLEKDAIPVRAYLYSDLYLTLSDTPVTLGDITLADKNGFSVIPDPVVTEPEEKTDGETMLDQSEDIGNDDVASESDRDEDPVSSEEKDLSEGLEEIDTDGTDPEYVDDKPILPEPVAPPIPESLSLYTKDGQTTIEKITEYVSEQPDMAEDTEKNENEANAENGEVTPNELYKYIVHPNGFVGNIDVYASLDEGLSENLAATVVSVDAPDKIVLSGTASTIAPFETAGITASAFYRNYPVSSVLSSYDWQVLAVPLPEPEIAEKEVIEDEGINVSEHRASDNAPAEEGDTVPVVEEVKILITSNVNFDDVIDETNEDLPEQEEQPIMDSEPVTPEQEPLFGVFADGVFIPNKQAAGRSFLFIAERGEAQGTFLLKVDAYPFADMAGHWAEKDIYTLHKNGVVKGEIAEDGTAFYFPERQFSRNEFCVMLARLTGIGEELELPEKVKNDENTTTEEVQDVDVIADAEETEKMPEEYSSEELFGQPEWAFDFVYRLYASGMLDGIIKTTEDGKILFAGQEPITRAEVIDVVGRICKPASEDYSLAGAIDLTDEQKADQNIKNAISAGIFTGFEDGSLRLAENLTRAQAAAVFVRLDEHLK